MGWMTIVADYTCQALISSLLFSHFPSDSIVGEEDSSELNTPENVATKAAIVRLSNEAMSESLEGEEEAAWAGVKADTRGRRSGWLLLIGETVKVGSTVVSLPLPFSLSSLLLTDLLT